MTTPPERIHGWRDSQLSIARFYGGITYQGHSYVIVSAEAGAPLVRADVLARPHPCLSSGHIRKAEEGVSMTTTHTSGAADLPEALIGAIIAAAYDFLDAHISGSKNLKRTAHAELESTVRNTLHALAAGQATAQRVVVIGESLVDWAMRATPEELNTANWGAVHKALLRARKELEITGVVHSWIGPYIDIARQESMKVAAPAQPAVQQAHYEEQPDGTTIPIDPSEMAPQQGAAYAALPAKYYLVGGVVKTWDEDQMCDFTDRTHAIRASRGQAPAQEDSVQEDAARYRWLRNKSQVVHNKAWFGGMSVRNHYGDFLCRDDALAALDTAIDADRKQGATQ